MRKMRANGLTGVAIAAATLLTACGGGDGMPQKSAVSTSAESPGLEPLHASSPALVAADAMNSVQALGRGALIDTPVLNKVVSKEELLAAIDDLGKIFSAKIDLPDQKFLNRTYKPTLELNGADMIASIRQAINPAGMICSVAVHAIEYKTVGIGNNPTDSSGAVMVPRGSDPRCQGPRPVVAYAHGTSVDHRFDMARFYDNPASAMEGNMIAAMFAARGYIVVAPNYVGYNKSTAPHPYINGTQQGQEVMDMVQASRKALALLGAQDSGRLFLTGYSQGGYVTAAAHREFQRSQREGEVTASAPLGAPTAISLLLDYALAGRPLLGGTSLLPMITSSWQRQFGDVYRTAEDFYSPQFASGIENLFPSDAPVADLVKQGRIAKYLLPEEASRFPYYVDTVFGLSAQALAVNALRKTAYAPRNASDTPLISMAAVNTVNKDILFESCPGNPRPMAGVSLLATWFNSKNPLNCSPRTGLRRAAVANDLRNWVPRQPMMMCGGSRDLTVDFDSTLATVGYFAYNGNRNVEALDLEGPALGRYASTVMNSKAGTKAMLDNFKLTTVPPAPVALMPLLNSLKNVGAETLVSATYHAKAMPFCLDAARTFFESELAKAGSAS